MMARKGLWTENDEGAWGLDKGGRGEDVGVFVQLGKYVHKVGPTDWIGIDQTHFWAIFPTPHFPFPCHCYFGVLAFIFRVPKNSQPRPKKGIHSFHLLPSRQFTFSSSGLILSNNPNFDFVVNHRTSSEWPHPNIYSLPIPFPSLFIPSS